jgi:hypothetical protein
MNVTGTAVLIGLGLVAAFPGVSAEAAPERRRLISRTS